MRTFVERDRRADIWLRRPSEYSCLAALLYLTLNIGR
jgi:hypothetical protein